MLIIPDKANQLLVVEVLLIFDSLLTYRTLLIPQCKLFIIRSFASLETVKF